MYFTLQNVDAIDELIKITLNTAVWYNKSIPKNDGSTGYASKYLKNIFEHIYDSIALAKQLREQCQNSEVAQALATIEQLDKLDLLTVNILGWSLWADGDALPEHVDEARRGFKRMMELTGDMVDLCNRLRAELVGSKELT